MCKLLKLVKLSWSLKLNMWRCSWYDKNSEEHILAVKYQKALDNLENTKKEVEALISETQALQNKFQDRKAITNLLSSVIAFLNHLEAVRG